MRFGGVHALGDVDLTVDGGQARRADRPERRRQDDVHRRDHRVRPLPRAASSSTARTSRGMRRTTARMARARADVAALELFDDLTVRENLEVAAAAGRRGRRVREIVPAGRSADDERVGAALERARARGRSPTRCPSELSQGQRKLVGVARALAAEPHVVLPRRAGRRPGHRRERGARRGSCARVVDERDGDAARRPRHGPRARACATTSTCSSSARSSPRARPRIVRRDPRSSRRTSGRRRREAIRTSAVSEPRRPTLRPRPDRRLRRRAGRARPRPDASRRARSSRCSAPTAPARRRRCAPSRGSSGPMAGTIRVRRATDGRRRRRRCGRPRWASPTCPEDRGMFFGLTVAEHFRLGVPRRARSSREIALDYFPALRELADRRAGLLSGGEQQMLAVGRALAREAEGAAAGRAQPRPGAGHRRAAAAGRAQVRRRGRLRRAARRAARAAWRSRSPTARTSCPTAR